MDENREEVYKAIYDSLEHIVNTIYEQLSVNEIEQLKKELKMTAEKTKGSFMGRFIGRIQGQKKLPLEFLAGELRKIGRDDLFWNQLENKSSQVFVRCFNIKLNMQIGKKNSTWKRKDTYTMTYLFLGNRYKK